MKMATEINDLKKMLKVIKDRLKKRQVILLSSVLKTERRCASGQNEEQEQEREKSGIWVWGGRCPSCNIYNEVESKDVKFESGLFGTPAGHYCKCLHCGYNDVSIENREF
jgi:hypothetical protein